MLYVRKILRGFPEWVDYSLDRVMLDVQVGDTAVSYEGVTIKHLMDFPPNSFRSAGAPEQMVRNMLEAGDRPLDVFRQRGVDFGT
jgi:hypothetical protein